MGGAGQTWGKKGEERFCEKAGRRRLRRNPGNNLGKAKDELKNPAGRGKMKNPKQELLSNDIRRFRGRLQHSVMRGRMHLEEGGGGVQELWGQKTVVPNFLKTKGRSQREKEQRRL